MLMMRKIPGSCLPYQHADWAVVPEKPGRIGEISVETVLAETGKVL
jgi:hypothetical protein